MKIYVSPFPDYYREEFYKGKTAVIIDIFRATTTILHLFSFGIKEIILLKDEKELKKYEKTNEILKIGERFGEKLDRFDFNNSASLLLKEKEKIKRFEKAIMLTTNGTTAALKSYLSDKLFVGAFNNIKSLIGKISNEKELILSLSGDKGEISLEDTIFGGNIIYELKQKGIDIELSDIALISLKVYEAYLSDRKLISASRHYKRLIELGFQDDIELALKQNIFDFVPLIIGNRCLVQNSPYSTLNNSSAQQ